jgi:hypothetical protein
MKLEVTLRQAVSDKAQTGEGNSARVATRSIPLWITLLIVVALAGWFLVFLAANE